jgi:hypothetical protein
MNQGVDHAWVPVIAGVETCERCGVLKVKTLSDVFYFIPWGPPFMQCSGSVPQRILDTVRQAAAESDVPATPRLVMLDDRRGHVRMGLSGTSLDGGAPLEGLEQLGGDSAI